MENVLTISILGSYAALLVLDAVAPARSFPALRWWRSRGIAAFVLYFAVASTLPLVWDAWLAEHRLIDATGLGLLPGAAAGLVALELGIYAWHRLLHRSPLLWRWFHQMHHSAERIDVAGAFYFHPLDMAGFTLVGSLSLVLVVGVSGEAAALATAIATVLAIVQHANIRTPHWLGYLVQRPEGHAVHHERGVHAYNFADLSVIDMAFGTFRNPRTWNGQGGFYDGASSRVGAMLVGRDVSSAAPAALPSSPPGRAAQA